MSGNRPLILIADDEEQVIEYFREVLQEFGCDVVAARDGREAIVLADHASPAVVIIDVIMPHLSGLAVCRHLRSQEATRAIPIIIATGVAVDEELREAFDDFAISRFLAKPVAAADLLVAVSHALESGSCESQRPAGQS